MTHTPPHIVITLSVEETKLAFEILNAWATTWDMRRGKPQEVEVARSAAMEILEAAKSQGHR